MHVIHPALRMSGITLRTVRLAPDRMLQNLKLLCLQRLGVHFYGCIPRVAFPAPTPDLLTAQCDQACIIA